MPQGPLLEASLLCFLLLLLSAVPPVCLRRMAASPSQGLARSGRKVSDGDEAEAEAEANGDEALLWFEAFTAQVEEEPGCFLSSLTYSFPLTTFLPSNTRVHPESVVFTFIWARAMPKKSQVSTHLRAQEGKPANHRALATRSCMC